jgi:hypothetical protein
MRASITAIAAVLFGMSSPVALADSDSEKWTVHGFGDTSVKNDYITPRGLVVTTAGVTVQTLNELVFVSPGGFAVNFGTWLDVNPGYNKHDNITALNEFDYMVGISGNIAKGLKAGIEYSEFISGQPSIAFQNEHNLEFSLKYADAGMSGFTFNPYAKLFYAFSSKSSTVVTGKAGDTFDVELGVVPTYKTGDVTFLAPTWVTVGPKTYWARPGFAKDGNLGTFATGLKVSTPSPLFKSPSINVYAQLQYFHLLNKNLVLAQSFLNTDQVAKRDKFVFGVGIGYGF